MPAVMACLRASGTTIDVQALPVVLGKLRRPNSSSSAFTNSIPTGSRLNRDRG